MKGAWFKSAEASVFVERKYHDPRSAVALDGDGVAQGFVAEPAEVAADLGGGDEVCVIVSVGRGGGGGGTGHGLVSVVVMH